ncbi:sulfurtransferase complex subunit TusB [Stutzerimonas tarimensis]|uniref:Sulfurtransferase complex subunit TusB n=1 Tax=Stutzerimonas tarimensis TaxID=1507735 RepID=A0ABV7T1T0_9GAMM
MATLHILSHSPFGDDRFASCLRLLKAGDGLLLTGDACNALRGGSSACEALERLGSEIGVFGLQEDVQARALNAFPARVESVDYAGFVELCCRYDRTNSWL